jgi:hypothetical protein
VIPLGVREYALIAVVVALGALGWRWWHLEGEVREQGAMLDGYKTALETANDRLDDLDEAMSVKLKQDQVQRQVVARRERGLEELKHADPTVRAWADQRIPDGVRALDAADGGPPADRGADDTLLDRGSNLDAE